MDMLLLDSWFKLDPGEGAFYAVFGFLFVFVGIALLIGIIILVGLMMTKLEARREKRERQDVPRPVPVHGPQEGQAGEDGISPETVAVITAAIAACLREERQKCEFVVRRIRKL